MKRRQMLTALAGTAILREGWTQTSSWPNKPIKLVVPYIAGSAPDVLARALADKLGPALGQGLVVDNRPGAGGNIGFDAIAKAPSDGYTLGLVTSGLGINASLYRQVPFDVHKDFSFLNLAFDMPHALIVAGDSPVRSVQELVTLLKAAPGKYNYSSGGNGTGAHLAAELFKAMTGVRAVHIPYRGAPEIVTSVIAGDVTFGFPTLATVIPLAKSGKVRVLGVTSEKRSPALPDVPAVGESVNDYGVTSWFGLAGPARLPVEVARRLDQELPRLLADQAFRASMQSKGTDVIGQGSQEFTAYFRKDLARWRRAVDASGARVD
ncbi:MAG: tripartite tricarboxylate transporter substrate binding protein [Pseudomonadota bacterium]